MWRESECGRESVSVERERVWERVSECGRESE